MYIDVREEVKDELDSRLSEATKDNGDIYRLTLPKDGRHGNHGDIIKYIDEEVKTLKDMKAVVKALINGLNREA
mgnify:FL=1|tara:strand:+ start:5258 stop:5479 length:222 start_codon:yes stop_codon:yes gene_type:complete